MLREIYLDTVRELAKSQGQSTPRKFVHEYHSLQNQYEAKALKALLAVLKSARTKFLPKFKAVKFEELYKSQESDVKAQLRAMLLASFAGASDELIASLEPLIEELAQTFASAYDVKLNFNMVNEKAVAYLRSHAVNYFSQLADDQAQGIFDTIATKMADTEAHYTLADIVSGIRSAFGKQSMYFPTTAGPRILDVTDWASTTARTETARAASFSQRASMESIGLQTWEWNTQETGCDICDDNDGEIVNIGDAFPSGDTEPPAHPNCRCIVTVVQQELTSINESGDSEKDET